MSEVNMVTVLYQFGQILRVQPVFNIARIPDSPSHAPRFIGTFRFGDYASGEGEGSNKNTTKCSAALDTLVKLRESRIKDLVVNYLLERNINLATLEKTKYNQKGSSTAGAAALLGSDNYVNKLQDLAICRRWNMPQYEDIPQEDCSKARVSTFVFKSTVTIGSRTFNEYGQGPNKKEAKKEAARKLFITLESNAMIQNGIERQPVSTTEVCKSLADHDKSTKALESLADYVYNPNKDTSKKEEHKMREEGCSNDQSHYGGDAKQYDKDVEDLITALSRKAISRTNKGAVGTLEQLVNKYNFDMEFIDYEKIKDNHLCLLRIHTEPNATVCCGCGKDRQSSHECAATEALYVLKTCFDIKD